MGLGDKGDGGCWVRLRDLPLSFLYFPGSKEVSTVGDRVWEDKMKLNYFVGILLPMLWIIGVSTNEFLMHLTL